MATYKVEAPDGSIIELEGPVDATDAQLVQAAQVAYSQRQPASEPFRVEGSGVPIYAESAQASTIKPPEGFQLMSVKLVDAKPAGSYYDETKNAWLMPTSQPGIAQEIGRQVGLTGRGAIEGVTGLAGIVIDPVTRLANIALPATAQIPTMQQATSQILDTAGFPQPRDAVERMVNQAIQGVSGAGGMAAAGRVAQTAAAPVTREVGRMLATQPVAQMAGGAGSGAAGQAVRESGGTPSGEILASLLGGVAGSAAASRAMAPARVPLTRVQPIVEEAGRRGVPVMTSDVLPPETFIGKAGQRLGERIPISGTGPLRAEQQQARIEAVRNVLRDFGADDAANLSDDIMKDLASKRSIEIQKYSQSKKEVINRLADKGTVPVPRALAAIDDQIADLTRRRTDGSDEAIKRLEQIKTDVQDRNLFQIEAYRQDELAKIFMDDPTRPMSIAARDAGEKAMRAIYGPVREDMTDFIKKSGERRDVDKFMVANKRLSETANELKMASLKSVLKSGEATSEVVNRLLFSQKPSEVRQLYTSLTPLGRATARASILSQAADKAKFEMQDGTKMFSPEKFNAEIKRLQPQIGVFFRGDDLKQVEGLSRVLNLTRRAGEAGVATATGQETVPFVAGSALQSFLGSFGGTLAAAGGIGLTARIYESAPVRNLMMKLGTTKRNSSEEAAIAKRLLTTIQTQSEAIQSKTQEETE